MSFGMFLGDLATAHEGALAGVQRGVARRRDAEDRDYELQQRDLRSQQQQRALKQQADQDQLDTELRGIKTTKPVTTPGRGPMPDGGVAPDVTTEAARTEDEVMREAADAFRRKGQLDRYFALSNKANEIAFKRSADQFTQFAAGINEATPIDEAAAALGKIYDSDPTGGGIQSIEKLDDGVRIHFVNKHTGATNAREFRGPNATGQLLRSAAAYYTPERFAAMQAEERKLQLKVLEEQAKTAGQVTSVPGGYTTGDGRGGAQFTQTQAGGSRAGSGSGAGKDADAQAPEAKTQSILTSIWKNAEDKPTQQQQAVARDIVPMLHRFNPGITPERAAKVANAVAQNPAAVRPAIDAEAGTIDQVFQDDDGSRHTVRRAATSPEQIAASADDKTKDDMRKAARGLVERQGNEEAQRVFVRAAFDAQAREALFAQALQAADAVVQEAISKNPQAEAAIRAQVEARVKSDLQAFARKLSIVRAFGDQRWGRERAAAAPAPERAFGGAFSGGMVPPADIADIVAP
jgi:hypothetical protein